MAGVGVCANRRIGLLRRENSGGFGDPLVWRLHLRRGANGGWQRLSGLACLAGLALVCSLASAAGFDDEFDEKPWAEVEVQLPAYPNDASLIPFRVGSVEDTQYFIDADSLSVGEDGVVRYVAVVISNAGARNVSYEGMRCSTAERRLYAFGRADGTWSKARGAQWLRIRGGSNNHVVELFSSYFCKLGSVVVNADDARRVLRAR